MTDLHELLHDAVADVDPDDHLDQIRARTTSPTRAARPWWYAAGGVVLATAATVAAFAVLDGTSGGMDHSHHHDHGAMTMPDTQLVAAYFIGGTPAGQRLFREFDRVPAGDPLRAALDRIQREPADPDYSTAWSPGAFTDATVADGVITVQIGSIDPSVDAAGLDVQQVVYTLQAAAGARLPVRFVAEGGSVYMGPLGAAAPRDVLTLVNISDPAEGNEYTGAMIARGRADVPERSVSWALADPSGVAVRTGDAVVGGKNGLGPWETTVDLSGLDPGSYVFTVTTDSEAFVIPWTDTRTITVR